MTRTTPSPEFDPRIADWLESGPDDAPSPVLETVLAAFPSIPQRRVVRVPWRFLAMNRFAQLGMAAAIAIVLVGGMLLVLRPGGSVGTAPSASPPTPSASIASSVTGLGGSGGASPSGVAALALANEFTSARYGYVVGYPAGWTSVPATGTWTAGTTNTWNSGLNDALTGGQMRFSGAAQLLAPGQTPDQWLATYAAGGDPASWPTVRIADQTGRIDYDGGPAAGGTIAPGGRMFDAVVVSGNVAFNFNMDGIVDRATFEAFLASIQLPSVPDVDKPFTSPLNRYSVQYPSVWSAKPATARWTSGTDVSDPSVADTFGSQPSFTATSTTIPAGTTFDAWYTAYDASRRKGTCGAAASMEDVVIDGVRGHLDTHCPTFYYEAVVSKGGRAYVFTLYAPTPNRPLFDSLIRTIRLTP